MMKVFEYSNKGCRETNQDYLKSCSLSEGTAVYVVADGMGGYAHGEIAAKVVSESIVDYISEHYKKMSPGQMIKSAFSFANESLSLKRLSLDAKEMGCVAVCLFIKDGTAYLAWLGDSRIYIFREGNEIYHTEDHSIVAELSKIRSISLDDLERYSSVVTRAIMGDDADITPSMIKSEIQEGDIFVLCTDGFHKEIPLFKAIEFDNNIKAELEAEAPMISDNFSFLKITI